MCKPGSVGGRGGLPPRSTRPLERLENRSDPLEIGLTPLDSTILVIGEDRFAIVATAHEVKASFFRPLQVTRYAWHDERLLIIRIRTDLGAI